MTDRSEEKESHDPRRDAAPTARDIQRADPKARRLALVFLASGAVVGTLLILTVEQYQGTIREQLLAEPTLAPDRIRSAFLISAVLLTAPLVIFAAYFWNLGAKVRRAQRFPPPHVRVIRDTPVVYGDDAAFRARVLQALAVGLLILIALLLAAFWYVAATLIGHWALQTNSSLWLLQSDEFTLEFVTSFWSSQITQHGYGQTATDFIIWLDERETW